MAPQAELGADTVHGCFCEESRLSGAVQVNLLSDLVGCDRVLTAQTASNQGEEGLFTRRRTGACGEVRPCLPALDRFNERGAELLGQPSGVRPLREVRCLAYMARYRGKGIRPVSRGSPHALGASISNEVFQAGHEAVKYGRSPLRCRCGWSRSAISPGRSRPAATSRGGPPQVLSGPAAVLLWGGPQSFPAAGGGVASVVFVAVSSVFCGVISADDSSVSLGLLSAAVTGLGMIGLFFVPGRRLPVSCRTSSARPAGQYGPGARPPRHSGLRECPLAGERFCRHAP